MPAFSTIVRLAALTMACGALAGMPAAPAAAATTAPLPTVQGVDLERYAGRWYEIARLPNWFERSCARDVSATYGVRPDGRIDVTNACTRIDGTRDSSVGLARVVGPGRLEVRFAPAWLGWLPFVWGDYWVLALDADYRHVLIGTPSREYLWILAREPALDATIVDDLLRTARDLGFPVDRVQRSAAPAGSSAER